MSLTIISWASCCQCLECHVLQARLMGLMCCPMLPFGKSWCNIRAVELETCSYLLEGMCAQAMGVNLPAHSMCLYLIPRFKANGTNSSRRPLTAAVAAAGRGKFVLDGSARMRERPIQDLIEGLQQLDVHVKCSPTGCPPVELNAEGLRPGQVASPWSSICMCLKSERFNHLVCLLWTMVVLLPSRYCRCIFCSGIYMPLLKMFSFRRWTGEGFCPS